MVGGSGGERGACRHDEKREGEQCCDKQGLGLRGRCSDLLPSTPPTRKSHKGTGEALVKGGVWWIEMEFEFGLPEPSNGPYRYKHRHTPCFP